MASYEHTWTCVEHQAFMRSAIEPEDGPVPLGAHPRRLKELLELGGSAC